MTIPDTAIEILLNFAIFEALEERIGRGEEGKRGCQRGSSWEENWL